MRESGLENRNGSVHTTPFQYQPGDRLDTPMRRSRHGIGDLISPNNLDFSGSDFEDVEEPTFSEPWSTFS